MRFEAQVNLDRKLQNWVPELKWAVFYKQVGSRRNIPKDSNHQVPNDLFASICSSSQNHTGPTREPSYLFDHFSPTESASKHVPSYQQKHGIKILKQRWKIFLSYRPKLPICQGGTKS